MEKEYHPNPFFDLNREKTELLAQLLTDAFNRAAGSAISKLLELPDGGWEREYVGPGEPIVPGFAR